MKYLTLIFLSIITFSCMSQDAGNHLIQDNDWYLTCRDDAAKTAKNKDALNLLVKSCSYRAIPKMCRGLDYFKPSNTFYESMIVLGSDMEKCVTKCKKSNIYSKTFGECSTG